MISKPTSVCYILSYYFPTYVRTHSLLSALKGIENISVSEAVNQHTGIAQYVETLYKLIRIRMRENPDYYILGFRGHEIYWLVRLITLGRPLIFDSLMSPYGALKEEKMGRTGAWISGLIFIIERTILRNCQLILTDTPNHVQYFSRTFSIQERKLLAVPVAAQEDVSAPSVTHCPFAGEDTLNVLFYGSFLPLHGVPIILEAIAELKELPLHVHFIGGTKKTLNMFNSMRKKFSLNNTSHQYWVAYDELLQNYIQLADVCLGGPFGNTPQSHRVITGKTTQCLSQGKATIIGRIDTDYPFIDRKNCLLVNQGDVQSLREALAWAVNHTSELTKIGQAGQALYRQHLSVSCISDKLNKAFS